MQSWLKPMLGLGLLILAALLEVGGDALIRVGLRGRSVAMGLVGIAVLASYGVTVNLLQLDFSRTLGTYVGVFAIISVAMGRLFFGDRIPPATWLGLALILAGSYVIQRGTLSR
jgi:drug/metabolite transporter superfamily protein YnfA